MAADVPTALCMVSPKATKVGTVSDPPPMPMKAERKPTISAITRCVVAEPLRCPISRVCQAKRMLAAIRNAITAKMMRSTSPENQPAISPPTSVPKTTSGAHSLRMRISSDPRLKWARALMIPVGMMIASEDPTATCCTTSVS